MNSFAKGLLAFILTVGVAALGFNYLIAPQINKNTKSKTVKISKVADSIIYFDLTDINESKRSEKFIVELSIYVKGQIISSILALPPAKTCPDGYLVIFEN